MMSIIRDYVLKNLLDPLKVYPTEMQNQLLELIIERLEELYELTILFPDIVTPSEDRVDILKTICEQYKFQIREEADLLEQVDILKSIIDVYRKRGSIDTIENMWTYYGGNLPRLVTVSIPSYNLFKYSVSSYSTNYFYPDGEYKRSGVLTITVADDDLQISREDLLEFLRTELVPAGTLINLILP